MRDEQECRRCGHTRQAHTHHRQGTDCALCDCARFRPVRRILLWLRRT